MRSLISCLQALAFFVTAHCDVAFAFTAQGKMAARTTNLDMTAMSEDSGRRGFLAMATSSLILAGSPSVVLADLLHKVDYPTAGKCGQADVPEKAMFFVKNLGGFQDGACDVEGYTKEEGTANGTGEKDKERTYSVYGKE